jgi:hypothetical protein
MQPYKNCSPLGGCQMAGTTEAWSRAVITIYRANLNNANPHIDYKKKSTIHEFGHVLSLAEGAGYTFSESVMAQGLSNNFTVKAYDKSELKKKWGN